MSGWIWVGVSTVALGTTAVAASGFLVASPRPAATLLGLAQTQSSTDSWGSYKLRLAALARQQGVREATIQTYVPGLQMNERVIELERTEPIARTSGGVVGALQPYLSAHVTGSLI